MSNDRSGTLRSTVMAAASHVDASAHSPTDEHSGTYALFFYGTLVHPAILARMIGHDGHSLYVQPAILPGYTLHHVKGEDYPALVPADQSAAMRGDAGSGQAAVAVRGSLVRGLSQGDVRKLDAFEGDEYIRTRVGVLVDDDVQPVAASRVPRDQSIAQTLATLTPDRMQAILATARQAEAAKEHVSHVYKWHAPLAMLEPHIWTFETFISSGNHTKWWNDAPA